RRQHRRLTLLLNVLLAGHTSCQPQRPRHLWAIAPGDETFGRQPKWVHEYFWANFGDAVLDEFSPPATEQLEKLDSKATTFSAVSTAKVCAFRPISTIQSAATCVFRRPTGTNSTGHFLDGHGVPPVDDVAFCVVRFPGHRH